jgi:hypothetical protein
MVAGPSPHAQAHRLRFCLCSATQFLGLDVSADRVIDEFVLEFTHDSEVPFMLPDVPTSRRPDVPTSRRPDDRTPGAHPDGRRDGFRRGQGLV